MKHCFFIGIGGSGVSALAHLARAEGNVVAGSDRNFDRHCDEELFCCLQAQDISLYPQDGSGITPLIDEVIVSAAIEQDNPDLKKAREFSLPVTFRSQFLARHFNASEGIAVAGSSGKSTITAMAARIMDQAKLDPTVINGAVIPDYKATNRLGNAKKGSPPYLLVETDESDGSIATLYPEISIMANISKDHKPVPDLKELFARFLANTKKVCVVNTGCPHTQQLVTMLPFQRIMTFGFNPESTVRAEDVLLSGSSSSFTVMGIPFFLSIPGEHNVSNALAAIALGVTLDIPLNLMAGALEDFHGVERRLQLLGSAGGVSVYDDFSHNPAKITAAIETLRMAGSRVIVIYQPHGYGPVRLLENELVETFNTRLQSEDLLVLLDIYDAGGTADRSITSEDLTRKIHVPQTKNIREREKVISMVSQVCAPGDVIVVMGARDNTLTLLARRILNRLKSRAGLPEADPLNA